jgi:adenylate cyclase
VTAVSEAFDRRLAAVMFTDMVGDTALIESDEQAAVEKRDRYVSALDRQNDAFGGTVVQRLGDGSMSMFPSSLAAVQAVVGMQQELAAQDVPVRIGVHVGEVVVESRRLTGGRQHRIARLKIPARSRFCVV